METDDFELSSDGTTQLKLQVLPSLIKSNLSANMIGNPDENRPKLYTEKLIGNIMKPLSMPQRKLTGKKSNSPIHILICRCQAKHVPVCIFIAAVIHAG